MCPTRRAFHVQQIQPIMISYRLETIGTHKPTKLFYASHHSQTLRATRRDGSTAHHPFPLEPSPPGQYESGASLGSCRVERTLPLSMKVLCLQAHCVHGIEVHMDHIYISLSSSDVVSGGKCRLCSGDSDRIGTTDKGVEHCNCELDIASRIHQAESRRVSRLFRYACARAQ